MVIDILNQLQILKKMGLRTEIELIAIGKTDECVVY